MICKYSFNIFCPFVFFRRYFVLGYFSKSRRMIQTYADCTDLKKMSIIGRARVFFLKGRGLFVIRYTSLIENSWNYHIVKHTILPNDSIWPLCFHSKVKVSFSQPIKKDVVIRVVLTSISIPQWNSKSSHV